MGASGGSSQSGRLTNGCSGPARNQLVTAERRWAPAAEPSVVRRTTNMKHLLIFLCAVATVSGVAASTNKSPSPQSFAVALTVTDKGDELFNSWDRPTGKAFNVEPVKTAARGKFLSAVVLFKGCKPDSAGNCDAVMDI